MEHVTILEQSIEGQVSKKKKKTTNIQHKKNRQHKKNKHTNKQTQKQTNTQTNKHTNNTHNNTHTNNTTPKTGILHYFKDPETGIHSNPIEGIFGWMKNRVISKNPQMNTNTKKWESYVTDGMFRHNYGCNLGPIHLINLLLCIITVKPVDKNALIVYEKTKNNKK